MDFYSPSNQTTWMVGALARALASNHEVRDSNPSGFISMVAIAMW